MQKVMRGNKIYLDKTIRRYLGINGESDYFIRMIRVRDGIILMQSKDSNESNRVNHETNLLRMRKDVASIVRGKGNIVSISFGKNGIVRLQKAEEEGGMHGND